MAYKKWTIAVAGLILILFAISLISIFRGGIHIDNNFESLLPAEKTVNLAAKQATQKYYDTNGKYLVLALEISDWSSNKKNVEDFVNLLQKSDMFENTKYRFSSAEVAETFQFYTPYKYQLMTDADRAAVEGKSNETVMAQAKTKIFSFFESHLVNLKTDPMGFFSQFLMHLRGANTLRLKDEFFVTENDDHKLVYIFTQLKEPWRDMDRQEQAMQVLDNYKSSSVMRMGYVPYAREGVKSAKEEISTIGLGSMIGDVLFILFIFKSLIPLLSMTFVIFFSLFIAVVITHFVFGSIHVFTLVLGSSLLGLIADYVFHYYAQQYSEHATTGEQALDNVYLPLFKSYLTTIVGFGLLLFTEFPALQQLSCIALFGFTCAICLIFLFLPKMPFRKKSAPAISRIIKFWPNTIRKLGRKYTLSVITVVLLLSVIGLSNVTFIDDISKMQSLPKKLRQDETLIKSQMGEMLSARSVLVSGKNAEELLINEETVKSLLSSDYSVQAISNWIPSLQNQRLNYEINQKLLPVYKQLYSDLKIDSTHFKNLSAQIKKSFQPIEFEQWLLKFKNNPISQSYLGIVEGQHFSVLRYTSNSDHLESSNKMVLVAQDPVITKNFSFVKNLNFGQIYTDKMTAIRGRVLTSFFISLLIIFLGVMFFHDLKYAVQVVFPPLIATVTSLYFSYLIIGFLNIFNVLGAVLVFFLCFDYSIFYADQHEGHEIPIAVFSSVLSTAMAFGIMSFSATEAVSAFGITILSGIMISFIFAPFSSRIMTQ